MVHLHLSHHPMLPVQRTAVLMGDLFELPISEATVLAACEEAKERLEPTVALIGQAMQAAPIAHADETGLRVAGSLHWMPGLATTMLTWVACHAKRGKEAFDALAILPGFMGTLIHDGWKSYREQLCKHGLCNAHHLRELTYVFEALGPVGADQLIHLLVAAYHEVDPENVAKPGRANRQTSSGDYVPMPTMSGASLPITTFLSPTTSPNKPFACPRSNRKSPADLEPRKGANTFCTIRSYLATMHKQQANLFHALTLTFPGKDTLAQVRLKPARPTRDGYLSSYCLINKPNSGPCPE